MRLNGADEQLWSDLLESDRHYLGRRGRFLREGRDPPAALKRALATAAERGAALRLLRSLPDSALTRAVLPELVRLASLTHSDTVLARQTIVDVRGESWLRPALSEITERVLADGAEEQYRRVAELLQEVDGTLLEAHLERCRSSSQADIREIADEYDASNEIDMPVVRDRAPE